MTEGVNFESYLCDVIYGRSLISELLEMQVENLRISIGGVGVGDPFTGTIQNLNLLHRPNFVPA